jgi:methionyl-tRNA formyltransferase
VRILIFGDLPGIPQSLRFLPQKTVVGIVVASIRPQYIDEIQEIAQGLNVPFLVQPRWQSEEYQAFKNQVSALNPDLIWVNSYSMIIRDDVLSSSRLGGVNIHTALLPRNRGCNPIQWAIIKGESETGVTLHMMTSGLDEGPVIDQKKVPIFFEDSWMDVRDRLEIATERLIQDNVAGILSENWSVTSQEESKATVGRRRTLQDGAFIWSESVETIYNKIRALLPPLPPAYFLDCMGEKQECVSRLSVWQVSLLKFKHSEKKYLQYKDVSLRPLNEKDSKWLWDCLSAQNKNINIGIPFPKSERVHIDSWMEESICTRSDIVLFVINDLHNNQAIGFCQFLRIDWTSRNATIQIFHTEESRQHGMVLVGAVRLLCQFGFSELDLHRINFHVYLDQESDIHTIENCGFKREGILREAAFVDGEWIDVLVMGKLKSDE